MVETFIGNIARFAKEYNKFSPESHVGLCWSFQLGLTLFNILEMGSCFRARDYSFAPPRNRQFGESIFLSSISLLKVLSERY